MKINIENKLWPPPPTIYAEQKRFHFFTDKSSCSRPTATFPQNLHMHLTNLEHLNVNASWFCVDWALEIPIIEEIETEHFPTWFLTEL